MNRIGMGQETERLQTGIGVSRRVFKSAGNERPTRIGE